MPKLICQAYTDNEFGGPQWVILDLTPAAAARLLVYRAAYRADKERLGNDFYQLSFWDYSPTWHESFGDDEVSYELVSPDGAVEDWHEYSGPSPKEFPSDVGLVKIGEHVVWTAGPKHGSGSWSTARLEWDVIERVAEGGPTGLPVATLEQED